MRRLGEKLRMLRKQHGLSQLALGKEVGVSQVHIARLELMLLYL
jgi:transcriptional regulator with XRE-family HTH domain